MLVTDAQVHIYELDRPDRPWRYEMPEHASRNVPPTPGGWSAEQMLAQMDAAGVDRAVIVPPFWAGATNITALDAVERSPHRFAIMGRIDPYERGAEERLAGWLKQPGMLGIRMSFGRILSSDCINDGSLDWFWAACERHNIPLMLLLGGELDKVTPLAKRHPELKLVMDHMGAAGGRGAPAFAQIEILLGLAMLPNVYVKMTTVPNYSGEPYPHRDVHQYLRRIYESYGPSRIFWGADFTRLEGRYLDCLRLFQEDLDFLSLEDREWILGKSLAVALDWPEATEQG